MNKMSEEIFTFDYTRDGKRIVEEVTLSQLDARVKEFPEGNLTFYRDMDSGRGYFSYSPQSSIESYRERAEQVRKNIEGAVDSLWDAWLPSPSI